MQFHLGPKGEFMVRHGLLFTLLALLAWSPYGIWAQTPTPSSRTAQSGGGTQSASDIEDVESDEGRTALPEPVQRSASRPSLLRRHAQAGFTPEEKDIIADKCKFGLPKPQPGAALGQIKVIVRDGYVLGHSSHDRIPYWVCEHAQKPDLAGKLKRKDGNKPDPFKPDPKLDGFPRAELKDYKGSGYDRGHMAPAGDQNRERRLKNETFYLSNMVPQIGPTYNRGIWKALEEAVRGWAIDRNEAWIITGPLFYDPLEEDESTADGEVPYYTIGDDEVAVPTHCYKIVFAKKDGEWQSIAFVLENKTYGKPFQLKPYIVTVKWIEDRAGLDFFSEFPDDPQNHETRTRLETQKSALWDDQ